MKNKAMKAAFIITVAVVGYNIYTNQKANAMPDIVLANIEALATGESSYGCGGNPTFIPDEALRTANCWNGGTHKKCKVESNVCCDPSQQTDCKGVI